MVHTPPTITIPFTVVGRRRRHRHRHRRHRRELKTSFVVDLWSISRSLQQRARPEHDVTHLIFVVSRRS